MVWCVFHQEGGRWEDIQKWEEKRKCWMGPRASGQLALSPLPCTQKGQQIPPFAKYSNNPKQQWLPHWRARQILIYHGKRARNKRLKGLCWVKPHSASKQNELQWFSTADNKLVLFICPEQCWQSRINSYNIRGIPQPVCYWYQPPVMRGKRYLYTQCLLFFWWFFVIVVCITLFWLYCSCSHFILSTFKLVNQPSLNIIILS